MNIKINLELLRAYRKMKLLNQPEIAKFLNVSLWTYQQIETGKRDLRVGELSKFCEVCEISKKEMNKLLGV